MPNPNQLVTQAVVTERDSLDPNTGVHRLAIFNEDGSPFNNSGLAPVVTATAIGTAAKTTTSPEPADNSLVVIKFTNGNSAAAVTVAFDGGTARAVHLGGATATGAELTVAAGGVALFWFDGTILHQVGVVA